MITAQYFYLLTKFLYCFETLFNSLWGRIHYVNAYMVFHHATVPFAVWIAVNYFPLSIGLFPMLSNLITHSILLPYLALINAFPTLKKPWAATFSLCLHLMQFGALLIFWMQVTFLPNCEFHWLIKAYGCVWGFILGLLYFYSLPMLRNLIEKFNSENKILSCCLVPHA